MGVAFCGTPPFVIPGIGGLRWCRSGRGHGQSSCNEFHLMLTYGSMIFHLQAMKRPRLYRNFPEEPRWGGATGKLLPFLLWYCEYMVSCVKANWVKHRIRIKSRRLIYISVEDRFEKREVLQHVSWVSCQVQSVTRCLLNFCLVRCCKWWRCLLTDSPIIHIRDDTFHPYFSNWKLVSEY